MAASLPAGTPKPGTGSRRASARWRSEAQDANGGTDDFWGYAGLAAVAWARTVADQRGLPLAELRRQLRAQLADLSSE